MIFAISYLYLIKNSKCLLTKSVFFFQVKDVKGKIEKEKGVDTFPSEKQKLIYNGKVLENGDPLSKYEINEKKFLVVMVPKPTAAPAKPAAETPAPTPATPAATGMKISQISLRPFS